MRASSDHIGRKGRCPACKALIDIRPVGDESLETIRPTAGATERLDVRLSSTSVAGWQAALAGGIATVLFFLFVIPLRSTTFGAFFLYRGPAPLLIMLLAFWGLATLAIKYFKVRRQMDYAKLELELIPLEIGLQITPSNVDQFLGHLANLPREQRMSIFGRRIHGALEHFKSRTSVPEVQEYLATQAEIDASSVDSGYTLLRAFIWAVPILGFIGTVMGISAAVGGLNTSISEGTGQQLMLGLGQVTQGLSTAFDTTLLALTMAILLLFPTESLRKAEYGMLDRIELFANESLLRRMSDEQGPVKTADLPDVVREALEGTFREHQRWLAQWQAQVGQLGQLIGADFEGVCVRVKQKIQEGAQSRLQENERLAQLMQEVLDRAGQSSAQWQRSEGSASEGLRRFLDAAAQLHNALEQETRTAEEVSSQVSRLWELYGQSDLGSAVAALAKQIDRLAATVGGQRSTRGWFASARHAAGRLAEVRAPRRRR